MARHIGIFHIYYILFIIYYILFIIYYILYIILGYVHQNGKAQKIDNDRLDTSILRAYISRAK